MSNISLQTILTDEQLQQYALTVVDEVSAIIETSRQQVAVFVNQHLTMMYWHTGTCLAKRLSEAGTEKYGQKIVATVSQLLTIRYGKGYNKSALTRMVKFATLYNDETLVATLSRQLTWSHFVELITIDNPTKRLYYQQMAILHHWSVRDMRHKEDDEMDYERALISAQPDDVQTRKLLDATLPDTSIDLNTLLNYRQSSGSSINFSAPLL